LAGGVINGTRRESKCFDNRFLEFADDDEDVVVEAEAADLPSRLLPDLDL
jgi:hypothetical protein